MYDLGTAEVRCFMWPEFKARRGASEVATCLAKFIEEKSNGGCKDLTLFYDNCPGTKRQPFCSIHAERNKQNTAHGQAMLNVPSERTYRERKRLCP